MAVGIGQRALGVVASAINGAAGEYVRERQQRNDMRRKMAMANYQKRLDGLDSSIESQTRAEVDRKFPRQEVPSGYSINPSTGQLINTQAELGRQVEQPPQGAAPGTGGPGYRPAPGVGFGVEAQSTAERNAQQERDTIKQQLETLLNDVTYGADVDFALSEAAKIGYTSDGKPHPNYKPITDRLKDIKRDRDKNEGDLEGEDAGGNVGPMQYGAAPILQPDPVPGDYRGQFIGEGFRASYTRPQPGAAAQPSSLGANGDVAAAQPIVTADKTSPTSDDAAAQRLYNSNMRFRQSVDALQRAQRMTKNDALRAAYQATQRNY